MKQIMIMKHYKVCMMACFAIIIMISCSDSRHEDYAKVVPKEAKGVAVIDFERLIEKIGIKRTPLFRLMVGQMSESLGSDVDEKIKELIKDPSMTGIDFSSPAYVFAINEQLLGASMKVDDESLLEEFFEMLHRHDICSKPKESDGCNWATLLDNNIRMVFSDNTLLLVGYLSDQMKVDDQLLEALMSLKTEDAFISTSQFRQMQNMQGECIKLYANNDIKGLKQAEVLRSITKILGKDIRLEDLAVVAGIDLREGGIDIHAKNLGLTDKAQQKINELQTSLKPLQREYVDKIPRGSRIWLCMGVNGNKCYDLLKAIPQTNDILRIAGLGVDVDQMIRSIDGDVMLYFSGNKGISDFGMYAQLANSDFMEDVDHWMESDKQLGIDLVGEGDGLYSLKYDGMELHWGVDHKMLYVGNNKYTQLERQGQNRFAEDMEDACLFVMADLSSTSQVANNVIVKIDRNGEMFTAINIDDFPNIIWKGLSKLN